MIRLTEGELEKLKSIAGKIPEQTCPQIDAAIKSVREVVKLCNRAARFYESVEDFADAVDRELWCTEGQMETLRKQNQRLRELGEYWYELFKREVEIVPEEVEARP